MPVAMLMMVERWIHCKITSTLPSQQQSTNHPAHCTAFVTHFGCHTGRSEGGALNSNRRQQQQQHSERIHAEATHSHVKRAVAITNPSNIPEMQKMERNMRYREMVKTIMLIMMIVMM